MYQSRTGRLNAPDPVGGSLLAPQAWNLYAYARNNPLHFIDPSGLTPILAVDCNNTNPGYQAEFAATCNPGNPRGGDSDENDLVDDSGTAGGQTLPPVVQVPDVITTPTGTTFPIDTGDSPTSCQEFVSNIVGFVSAGSSGTLNRLAGLPGKGTQMMGSAFVSNLAFGPRLPLRAAGREGFRVTLTDFGQAQDVYKHVVFTAGAVLNGSPAGSLFVAYDFYEVHKGGREEARSELFGDVAGAAVGAAIYAWGLNGDTPKLRRRITRVLCQ